MLSLIPTFVDLTSHVVWRQNLDSPDHKSHVAFLSGGPDSGTCSDPKYPVTLPRIFIEVRCSSALDSTA